MAQLLLAKVGAYLYSYSYIIFLMRRYLLSLFLFVNISVLATPTFAQFPIWSPFGENRILMNLAYYPGANSTYESTTTDGDFKCSDTK